MSAFVRSARRWAAAWGFVCAAGGTGGAQPLPAPEPAVPVPVAPATLPPMPVSPFAPLAAPPAAPAPPGLPQPPNNPPPAAAPVPPPGPAAHGWGVETRAPAAKPADPPLRGYWKDGPYFATEDGLFTFRPSGRIQFDTAWYAMPAALRAALPGPRVLDDGVAFRRARLNALGTFYRTIDFNAEFDFANGIGVPGTPVPGANAVGFTDLWLTFRQLPVVGNLRVGSMKPPISFEHITSSKFLNFLERSPGFDAVAESGNNGFTPGIMAFDNFWDDDRGYWAVGVFKNTRNPFAFNAGRNEAELTGRVVALPVYEFGGRRLLHLGLGASHRDLDDGVIRYRARYGVRSLPGLLTPPIVDTGLIPGSNEQRLVPELAGVFGPLSFQAEYYAAWLQGADLPAPGRAARRGTAFFHGAYAEVHYFLTGEHRAYDHERMAFGRVVPRRPLRWTGCDRGPGAWQVAARYSYLDLDDRGILGGVEHELVFGLNWFLTGNAKVQANYVLTHRDAAGTAGDGWINGFGVRTAWDF